jgi:hypothetical protein
MIRESDLPFHHQGAASEELDMKTVILGLIFVVLVGSPALAQYFIVPGGGMLPDGSVRFSIPVGVPYKAQSHAWHETYGVYSHYMSSPVYWIPYPYVSVPVGRPQPQNKQQ